MLLIILDKNKGIQIPKLDPQNANIVQLFQSFHNDRVGQSDQVLF